MNAPASRGVRRGLLALLLTHGTLAVAIATTYATLPDRVASHFTASGRADGWSSRPAYAASLLGGAALTSILCVAPLALSRHLPDSLLNIPDREYWLAPERRDEAYAKLLAFGLGTASLATGLFVGLHLLTVRANRVQPPRLPLSEGMGLMAVFLIGLGLLIYHFQRRAWRVRSRPEG
ncbi:DUF1648 domain-containing protein [Paludisphaera soli]|uniref:DUF1648 domain-containing protein n=1 Tax=Paludisphaera soli TaxID=2712865 RepID=UPI0013EC2AFD|nr:DUF1648 domain-containing protein [Paludisphaera soli]